MNESRPTFIIRDINRLFDLDFSRDQYTSMIEKGEIPSPSKRGKGSYRCWTVDDLPQIGKSFHPLISPKRKSAIICSVYVAKGGGSWKTTFTYNFAKYLAMHGKKVLCVGLDPQQNLTRKFGIDNRKQTVLQTKKYYKGLYEAINEDLDINDVIFETNTKNIDIIPESAKLFNLQIYLNSQSFREGIIKDKLNPINETYDIILFDNNPSWDVVSINSVYASDLLIAPVGIDSNSQETIEFFIETLNTQLKGIELSDVIFAPGFHENNEMKRSIFNSYQKNYNGLFTKNNVRKATSVDEASFKKCSIFEYDTKAAVTEDFKRLFLEIWDRSVSAVDKTLN
jgi:chromosome partitioning protein